VTPEELETIKARAEAASPGPWTWQHTGSRHWLARGDVLDVVTEHDLDAAQEALRSHIHAALSEP
jgi:hypothetical protein